MDGARARSPAAPPARPDGPEVIRLPPADAVRHYSNLFLDQPSEFERTYFGNALFCRAVNACGLALVPRSGHSPALVRIAPSMGDGNPRQQAPYAPSSDRRGRSPPPASHPTAPSYPVAPLHPRMNHPETRAAIDAPGYQASALGPRAAAHPGAALQQHAPNPEGPVPARGELAPAVQRLFDAVPAPPLPAYAPQGKPPFAGPGGPPPVDAGPHAPAALHAVGYHSADLQQSLPGPLRHQRVGQQGEHGRAIGAPAMPGAAPDYATGQSVLVGQGQGRQVTTRQDRQHEPLVGLGTGEGVRVVVPAPAVSGGGAPESGLQGPVGDAFDIGALAAALPPPRDGPAIADRPDAPDAAFAGGARYKGNRRDGPGTASSSGFRRTGDRSKGAGRSASLPPRPVRVTPRTNEPLQSSPSAVTAPSHVIELLSRQAWDLFHQIRPEDNEADRRTRLLAHMNKIIRSEWPQGFVRMFGSGASGLNLRGGDVDMCLIVPPGPHPPQQQHHQQQRRQRRPRRGSRGGAVGRGDGGRPVGGEDVAVVDASRKRNISGKQSDKVIMRTLVGILRRSKMSIIQELPAARVPIVKVADPVSKFRLDVCLNNELGYHNTNLLRAYTSLDPRVRPLCLLLKHWAKRRGINEAYRGTLSSYAYVLLIIHYLQTLEKPVLPCLQQMHSGRRVSDPALCPVQIVVSDDGVECNVHFDASVGTCDTGNRMSLGELLIDFFHHYAFEFNYKEHVACVRLGRPISRVSKEWDEASVQSRLKKAEDEIARDMAEMVQADERAANGKGANQEGMTVGPGPPPPNFGLVDDEHFPTLGASISVKGGQTASNQPGPQKHLLDSGDPNYPSTGATSGQIQAAPQRKDTDGDGGGFENRLAQREAKLRKLRKAPRHVFSIEDPFDLTHDLGRNLDGETLNVIRHEFVRAHTILVSSGDLHRMLEKYSE